VEQLISSHMALGNWEEADTYNNYLFHVQKKAYKAYDFDDPLLIPVLDRLATWNIQAFKIGYGTLRGSRLLHSQKMFDAAARMVSMYFGKSDERYINYQRSIANSAYLVVTNSDLVLESEGVENRNMDQIYSSTRNVCQLVKSQGFLAGERALKEIVTFYQERGDDIYGLAEAITHLADWYLRCDKRRDALENYKVAWDMLQGLENSKELTELLFGNVVPLPSFSSSIEMPEAFYRSEDGTEALSFDHADLTFDVTVNGRARNVKSISEETEDNQAQLSKLRRSVRSMWFRPLLVDGEPARSFENHFRYRYWY
jgi:hypothetical protein